MLQQILMLLLNTAANVFLLFLWLRFLLQLVRADFYNPVSQTVVRVTDVVLKPLRRIMPPVRNYDVAALAAIILLELLTLTSLSLLRHGVTLPPLLLLLRALFTLLWLATDFFLWAIIISAIASWIVPGYNPYTALLNQLVEPLLAPMRRLLPGMGGIDLSPVLALLAIQIVQIVLANVGGAYIVGL